MIISFGPRRLALVMAALAALVGSAAAIYYATHGLTLSHYDARGHLVVARRLVDSVTPGWQQIGAVWLPLPHLLNALPVQVDLLYRTGGSAVALSVMAHAATVAALAWLVHGITGSAAAAATSAAVFGLNPNPLYLQSTPMTEPLLLACLVTAVAALFSRYHGSSVSLARVGLIFAAGCLTRYEAWPVTGAASAALWWTEWRRGRAPLDALAQAARLACAPAAAALGFLMFSRIVVGRWFVSDGFFVPDPTHASPIGSAAAIWAGTVGISGSPLLVVLAGLGLATLAARGVATSSRAHELVPLALAWTAVLPYLAFLRGHPVRVRYMVPLLAIEAVGVGVLVGRLRRGRALGAVAVGLLVTVSPGPLAADAPVVVEAQRDVRASIERQRVTRCLQQGYRGESIMASMGSLGHYMQETAAIGVRLRDYLHEGNGDIWLAALESPRPYTGWILIDERSEGGDMLAHLANTRPSFLEGFDRVCEGGGVSLYRRAPRRSDRSDAAVRASLPPSHLSVRTEY